MVWNSRHCFLWSQTFNQSCQPADSAAGFLFTARFWNIERCSQSQTSIGFLNSMANQMHSSQSDSTQNGRVVQCWVLQARQSSRYNKQGVDTMWINDSSIQRKIFWIWDTEQFWGTIDFQSIYSMEVNGIPKQPDYKLSSKYLALCSAEEQRNSYRFGTNWG